MAKRRKIKKSTLLVGGIIGFFVIYFITFKVFSMMESSKNNPVKVQTEVDNRSLLRQLKGKDKIYLSDDKVADVRVEAELLEELRYSFVGLVKYALGMDAETKNRMFCSEFVAHVLNSKYNNTDGYYSSQVRPEDFKSFENFKLVQRGKLSDYDPSVTIARVSRMKKPTK